jgi:hypothetical protein
LRLIPADTHGTPRYKRQLIVKGDHRDLVRGPPPRHERPARSVNAVEVKLDRVVVENPQAAKASARGE